MPSRVIVHAATSMVLATVLIGTVVPSLGQPISYTGPGCGQAAPGPPSNLKAEPGDKSVKLTWNPPSNGACVDRYEISAVQVGTSMFSASQPLTTQKYEYTVTGLQNGKEYRFTVTAVAGSYPPQSASVTATPNPPAPPPPVYQVCLETIYPTGPANLHTTSVERSTVTLCWDPPSNNGCADSYSLTVTPIGAFQALALVPIRIQSSKCYTVNNLNNGTRYQGTVQSYNNYHNGGGSSSIEFTTLK